MYVVTVRSQGGQTEKEVVYSVPEYEVKDAVLTLAVDDDHDIVIPLCRVTLVDIQRHR